MLVNSVYPKMTLHPKALACDRTSIRSSFHHESRVSGSSGFGTRSSNFTDRAQTAVPNCSINSDGYFVSVKNGYSSMSKFSKFNGVFRFGVPAIRNIPDVVRSVFNEHPERGGVDK